MHMTFVAFYMLVIVAAAGLETGLLACTVTPCLWKRAACASLHA
jgi:hypothetical protein